MDGMQLNSPMNPLAARRAARDDDGERSPFMQAFGFDAKKMDDFIAGVARLTRMQRKILMHLVQGKLNKEIAYACDLSVATVKAHSTQVFEKLKTRTRAETAAKFAVYLLLYE